MCCIPASYPCLACIGVLFTSRMANRQAGSWTPTLRSNSDHQGQHWSENRQDVVRMCGLWRGKVLPRKIKSSEAMTYFAHAIGAARSGNAAQARADGDQLQSLSAALRDANQSYIRAQQEQQNAGGR